MTEAAAPILLRLRSGRTAGLVLALGFGGGTILLGVGSALPGGLRMMANALAGYGLAALPFVLFGAVVAACRSELWLVPEARAIRLLTFRPWRRGPAIEQAPLSEYAGVRVAPLGTGDRRETGGALVSLVTAAGEDVAVRELVDSAEALAFAREVSAAAGLWLREGDGAPEPAATVS